MINPVLAVIPSAYKTSKLYSVLPFDGGGDFVYSSSGNGTRINSDKLVEDVPINTPVLDYTHKCPSLLLERASTNLLTYSNDYTNAAWTKTNATITDNVVISPDGTKNADKLVCDGVGDGFARQTVSTGSIVGRTFTYSVWIWTDYNQPMEAVIYVYGATGFEEPSMNTVTITSEPQRFEVTQTFSGSAVSTSVIGRVGSAASPSAGDYIYIYGSQLEELSYATSYIPTTTTSLTRNTQTCKLENHGLFSSYPITVYWKGRVDRYGSGQFAFSILDISVLDKYLGIQFTSSSSLLLVRRNVNNDGDSISYNTTQGNEYKIAVTFIDDTSYKLYINGSLVASTTTGLSVAWGFDDILLGQQRVVSDSILRNSVNDFRVYDYELTDTQLTEITS